MTKEQARRLFVEAKASADAWRSALIETFRDGVGYPGDHLYLWIRCALTDEGDEAIYTMHLDASDTKSIASAYARKTIRLMEVGHPLVLEPGLNVYTYQEPRPWTFWQLSKDSFLRRVVLWLRRWRFKFNTKEFKALFEMHLLTGLGGAA